MGDMGEAFNDWKAYKKAIRATFGVNCPRCQEKLPKAHPTILLPQQVCNVDGYRDPRPRLTERQKAEAATQHNAPVFVRVKS